MGHTCCGVHPQRATGIRSHELGQGVRTCQNTSKAGLKQAKTSETARKVITLTNTATAAKLVSQKIMVPYSTPSRWLTAQSVHVGLPEAPAATRLHAYLTTDRWLTILSVCSPCTAFSSALSHSHQGVQILGSISKRKIGHTKVPQTEHCRTDDGNFRHDS